MYSPIVLPHVYCHKFINSILMGVKKNYPIFVWGGHICPHFGHQIWLWKHRLSDLFIKRSLFIYYFNFNKWLNVGLYLNFILQKTSQNFVEDGLEAAKCKKKSEFLLWSRILVWNPTVKDLFQYKQHIFV